MTVHADLAAGFAPAKLNLTLHVVGQRPDGYHLLESLAVFAGFGDHIHVRHASEDEIAVRGPYAAQVPLDGSNLVARARDRLRALHPGASPVSILLEKRLPVASGIGGGSSDAAAALRTLAHHWRIADALIEGIAPGLGADVPMCLAARPLIARGIGERLQLVASMPQLDMVLVNPGDAVPTPQVFAALAARDNAPMPELPRLAGITDLVSWLRLTRNDLETPARGMAPRIGEALDALAAAGAMFARMSGSGATCFGIFDGAAAAQRAADAIGIMRPGWFVAATTTGGA